MFTLKLKFLPHANLLKQTCDTRRWMGKEVEVRFVSSKERKTLIINLTPQTNGANLESGIMSFDHSYKP